MYYNGKNIDLREFVAERKKEYTNIPAWYWEDEGIVYAVADYYSSMGEFSQADKEYIKKERLEEIAAWCEEDLAA